MITSAAKVAPNPQTATATEKQKASIQTTPVTESSDRVVISGAGQSRLDAARDIMSRYDLRNISYNNLKQLGRELYGNGLISGEQMLDMTAPTFETGSLPGNGSPAPRFSPDTPRDYLALYEGSLAFKKANLSSDRNSIAWTERTLSLFRHFESM